MATILLVDDDDDMRHLWALYLAPFQHDIHHAINGVEALYMAQHYKPDLVILDLMMPMASGDLVLGFLRSTQALKQIAVLVVSAHHNVGSLARQYEADAYLQKPILRQELIDMVDALLAPA